MEFAYSLNISYSIDMSCDCRSYTVFAKARYTRACSTPNVVPNGYIKRTTYSITIKHRKKTKTNFLDCP